MTELVSLSLRHAFREFCVSYLVVRNIEEIFRGYGVKPSELDEDELRRLSGARRTLVEQFYKTLDWASIRDTEVFLDVVSHVLEVQYTHRPEATDAQEKLKEACLKNGFIVNESKVTFPEQGGVKGRVKNLIFASIGEKPEIIFRDSVNNDIQIVKNAQNCLIYDQPTPERGLLWKDMLEWWSNQNGNSTLDRKALEKSLYQRLLRSLTSSVPEQILFKTYMKEMAQNQQEREKLFALIPQVYLHYDPYTLKQRQQENEKKPLARQRMDFLLLFSHKQRVVIEIDGQQHYSSKKQVIIDINGQPQYSEENIANPSLYKDMVVEDRRLKLAGYEVYRFGGYEFLKEEDGKEAVLDFFSALLRKYA